MANRLSDLKKEDLIDDEPLVCCSCSGYMKLDKDLENCKGKGTNYRRRRFKCEVCGFEEVIFADGNRDVTLYVREEEKIKRFLTGKP